MLLEAWSPSDIRSLVGDQWCISEVGFFNDHTFNDFARSYVLYRKKTEGGMEVIGFHIKDDQGIARIKCAFDLGNDHCENYLEQVLESAPARLRDSLRGFTEEDVCQKLGFWMANTKLESLNITVPEDIYKKALNQWVVGSHPEWSELSYDEKASYRSKPTFFCTAAWGYQWISKCGNERSRFI